MVIGVNVVMLVWAGIGVVVICLFLLLQPDDLMLVICLFWFEFVYRILFVVLILWFLSKQGCVFMWYVQLVV